MICAALLSATACTNDGDIGDLYGNWQLRDCYVDDTLTHPNRVFMKFQDLTVEAQVVYPAVHLTATAVGNYRHEGDSLHAEFLHFSDDYEGLTLQPFLSKYFGFDSPESLHFKIEHLDRTELRLSRGEEYWNFRSF